MQQNFYNLKVHKQQQILNAAMREFAAKGYDRASTNVITQSAGISKGLLFHYFKNKETLYFDVMEYARTQTQVPLADELSSEPTDLLDWMQAKMIQKAELLQAHPDIFGFLQSVFKERSPRVRERIIAHYGHLHHQAQTTLLERFDFSRLLPDIDRQMAYNTIMFTLEKVFLEAFAHADCEMSELVDSLQDYLHFFRQIFYQHPPAR